MSSRVPINAEEAERLARLRIYAASNHVTGEEAERADAIADIENAEDENQLAFLLRLYDAERARNLTVVCDKCGYWTWCDLAALPQGTPQPDDGCHVCFLRAENDHLRKRPRGTIPSRFD